MEKSESVEERIARLRRELVDAETEKLRHEMRDAVSGFVEVCGDADREVARAAIGFVRDAWARFSSWLKSPSHAPKRPPGTGHVEQMRSGGFRWRITRDGKLTKSKTWPTFEEAEKELNRFVSEPGFVPASKNPLRSKAALNSVNARRPPGSGSVYRTTHNGWRWSIRRSGMAALQGQTFASKEEAQADLDRVVAERAAGTAPPDMISAAPVVPVAPKATAGPAVKKEHRCMECGEVGHNARRHAGAGAPPRLSTAETVVRPSAIASRAIATKRRIAAAAGTPAEAIAEDDEWLINDDVAAAEAREEGWKPADADGRQECIPCGGSGVDERPGPGAGGCCLNCDGEGYRWPAEARSTG